MTWHLDELGSRWSAADYHRRQWCEAFAVPSLQGRIVLVVEDEYLLAEELASDLHQEGVIVAGPAATVEHGIAVARAAEPLSAAILDLNLCGDLVFPLADELVERDVPFLFLTGYDADIVPPRFAGVERFEKPMNIAQVLKGLRRALRD